MFIASFDEALWWMATEFAERAESLPVEPSASLLMEMAVGLGHPLTDKEPLSVWMEALYAVLQKCCPPAYETDRLKKLSEAEKASVPLHDSLKKLVEACAVGLPISWMRLQAERQVPVERLNADAASRLGLDPTTPLDRGDWIALVFKELLLNRRIQGFAAPAAQS